MDAAKYDDEHMASATAFCKGEVQESCDDACSICLEEFSQDDPSTAINCDHEFHLHCILEWCQRSSNCPMCWQPIIMKDAASQEVLEAMEIERIAQSERSRNATLFVHSNRSDFDLQHLPFSGREANLEEHIFQHLAAAAAMERSHHHFQREGQRNRSSSQARHPFLSVSSDVSSTPMVMQQRNLSETRSFAGEPSVGSQEATGPSDLQSLSDSLRSRFNSWSTRYKKSILRNTRGWKERLFACNTSIGDAGREMNTSGFGMMSRLDSRENDEANHGFRSSDVASTSNMNDL